MAVSRIEIKNIISKLVHLVYFIYLFFRETYFEDKKKERMEHRSNQNALKNKVNDYTINIFLKMF